MRLVCLCAAFACLISCGTNQASQDSYEVNTIPLTLPDGETIRVEVMVHDQDMRKGMMFRDEMKPGHGMLFFHPKPVTMPYWMFQVKIPLDIIWLDADRKVVEMIPNVPPCTTVASQCPSYGGNKPSSYVLELAGGMAQKYGLRVGESVAF